MIIRFYKVDAPYGCFSNFSPHPIICGDHEWPTVEHYYQAQKFVGSADAPLIETIRAAPTPEAAAALGRNPCRQRRRDWETAKKAVMWQGVLTKFRCHPDIQSVLLATGDAVLIEDSPRDYFWGCGQDGTGANELGQLLMAVRQHLRQQP